MAENRQRSFWKKRLANLLAKAINWSTIVTVVIVGLMGGAYEWSTGKISDLWSIPAEVQRLSAEMQKLVIEGSVTIGMLKDIQADLTGMKNRALILNGTAYIAPDGQKKEYVQINRRSVASLYDQSAWLYIENLSVSGQMGQRSVYAQVNGEFSNANLNLLFVVPESLGSRLGAKTGTTIEVRAEPRAWTQP